MVLETCCCCVNQVVGAFFVASIEIVEGLAFLGFGITWDTILTAIMFLIAGICLMDGIIRRNLASILVNVTFVIVGICFIIASSIKYFLIQSHYHIHEPKTIARLLFFIFIPIDICFLVYVQNIYKTLKPKKEEEDCTKIIFWQWWYIMDSWTVLWLLRQP